MSSESPKKPPDDPRTRPRRRQAEWAREERDPNLKLTRAADRLRRLGMSEAAIAARIEGMAVHRRFPAALLSRGCDASGVAAATREVSIAATGHTPRELRALKGLPESASVRDHLTETELIWTRMAEGAAVEAIRTSSATGNAEVAPLVRVACAPVMAARLAHDAAKTRWFGATKKEKDGA